MTSQRRWILSAFLFQGLLLFSNTGLLPLWGDELFMVRASQQPVPQMFETLREDMHPPLFPLVEHYWSQLPLGMDEVAQMRVLPALFAWAASVFACFMALPGLSEVGGRWFAILLACSPCLVLYGRMIRSYSMQMLAVLIAVDQFLRLKKSPTVGRAVAYGLSLALVAYVHYAPAAVLAMAGAALLIGDRQFRSLSVSASVALFAFLPWLASALPAIERFGSRSREYFVTGNFSAEHLVKLGYWGLSFLFGESFPWWIFVVAIPVSAAQLWLAWQGSPRTEGWGRLVGVVAVLSYLVVSRWVSYPFVPAALLFLLPFVYWLLAYGAEARPHAARIILGCLLFCSAVGLWSYYRVQDYLNWAYAAPYKEMAADIVSQPGPSLVHQGGTSEHALFYYLPRVAFVFAETTGDPVELAKEISAGQWKRVFILHNTHQSAPNQFYTRLHQGLIESFPSGQPHFYGPRSVLDNWLIERLGWKDANPYFFQLDEYER